MQLQQKKSIENQGPGPEAAPEVSSKTKAATSHVQGFDAQSAALSPATPVQAKGGGLGHDLKSIQERLNTLGFDCGKADGIMGPKTRGAIVAFQGKHGLTPDGIVGPITRAALETATPGQAPTPAAGTKGASTADTKAAPAGGTTGTTATPSTPALTLGKGELDPESPGKSPSSGEKGKATPDAKPVEQVPGEDPQVTRLKAVASGRFASQGQFKAGPGGGFAGFENADLQAVLLDVAAAWGVGDVTAAADASAAAVGGDSAGKTSSEHPMWVKVFQEKCMGLSKAQWDDRAAAAQKLCEAFLRAWASSKNGGAPPANVEHLLGLVGSSESNEVAAHLGGHKDAVDWCAMAVSYPVIIGLMKAGLRFKAVKPATSFPVSADISKQAHHFFATWVPKHGKSDGVIAPGDAMTIVGHGPASGHWVTAVHKPDPTTRLGPVDVVSGNAGGVRAREGAVRSEQINIVEPPSNYNYTRAHTNDPTYTGPKKADREPKGNVYLINIIKGSRLDPEQLLASLKPGQTTNEELERYGLETFDLKATFSKNEHQKKELSKIFGI